MDKTYFLTLATSITISIYLYLTELAGSTACPAAGTTLWYRFLYGEGREKGDSTKRMRAKKRKRKYLQDVHSFAPLQSQQFSNFFNQKS